MTPRIYIPGDSGALALGAEKVAKAIANELAERGIEAKIVRNGSRGAYFLEPMVEVATANGRVAYGPVKPSDVKSLFDSGFLKGGHHKRWLGAPDKIPFLAKQTRLTFARCGINDPLSLDAYKSLGGLKGLQNAVAMAPADIVSQVTDSGLRGRGGAGFPTGIKWKTVLDTTSERKYIVCNADEGDSATFADRMIMEGDPFVLIEGMAIAGIATGATKGFVYIRSEYPHAVAVMNKAVEIARKAGVLGVNVLGSPNAFDMEIRVGAGAYVCGEETSLLNSLEGKRGVVRA
ncbi:MAG: formate dehydrogenase, partial [Mesorhizobium sp.]